MASAETARRPPAPVCASYLCENTAAATDTLCAGCRATERLCLDIGDAMERFLNAEATTARRSDDRITTAGIHLATAVAKLAELATCRPVVVTFPPWLDVWGDRRWHSGLAWDIAEDQGDERQAAR